jgi:hypothetical protein
MRYNATNLCTAGGTLSQLYRAMLGFLQPKKKGLVELYQPGQGPLQ